MVVRHESEILRRLQRRTASRAAFTIMKGKPTKPKKSQYLGTACHIYCLSQKAEERFKPDCCLFCLWCIGCSILRQRILTSSFKRSAGCAESIHLLSRVFGKWANPCTHSSMVGAEAEREVEYLVKWVGQAHIHNEWVGETLLLRCAHIHQDIYLYKPLNLALKSVILETLHCSVFHEDEQQPGQDLDSDRQILTPMLPQRASSLVTLQRL